MGGGQGPESDTRHKKTVNLAFHLRIISHQHSQHYVLSVFVFMCQGRRNSSSVLVG